MKSIVEDRTYLKDPVLRGFLEKVCAGDERVRVSGPDGSAKALLTALVRRFSGKTTLVVVPTLAKAAAFLPRPFCLPAGRQRAPLSSLGPPFPGFHLLAG